MAKKKRSRKDGSGGRVTPKGVQPAAPAKRAPRADSLPPLPNHHAADHDTGQPRQAPAANNPTRSGRRGNR